MLRGRLAPNLHLVHSRLQQVFNRSVCGCLGLGSNVVDRFYRVRGESGLAPIVGVKDNGLQGFCLGLANGIVGAVALPVTGAAVATLQIGRGVVNTAEAAVESASGKDWDQERREWYQYDLQAEADKMLSLDEFAPSPGSPGREGGGGMVFGFCGLLETHGLAGLAGLGWARTGSNFIC